ncbi:winged helix-turn-helix domain-containing protein [Streptomyces sp. NBC_01808]|uniref:AfsR/SARP family transcriptional regulator n=1 Tax=Streptomyces sp. NBC_01808 TaxID=2975947 RepID=UPI002DD987D1|nr:BTAD domain-containing putative transcriptional regulator [Streptomyces sp. NBC_01808]WSA39257.1 winged helix-turn-helix domain-containing protein [Streptomyces sp. NBC_01808]
MLQIGTPRQRALLAILLLSDGRAASPEELIEGIWENPPESAQAALRTYAYRLRKCLGPDTLVHDAGRYALRIRDSEFDLAVAEERASSAEAAAAAGHAEHARDLYATALQFFVGEPLAGVPGPYAERHRERLSKWRQTLLERRVELDLATGRYDEAVADLTALTPTNPLNDRLRELLVLAQHRNRPEG